jgi:peptidoglycan/LPS O-acetylase OafA/YrhL
MPPECPATRRAVPDGALCRQPQDSTGQFSPESSGSSGPMRNQQRKPAGPSGSHLSYRRDIDGLRAIAVIAVIGYHLQISWVSGGFVGVDVFFVISGYLIGALILNEVKAGKFSLVSFYARRARRIVPAFAAMVISILVLSYFALLPSEYTRLAWGAFYAALSASNIYFLGHTGYFDAPASTQPLLHTWSLGVEEQFYLFFPLIIIPFMWRFPKLLNAGLALVWAGSFVLSIYGVHADPQAAFYLAPARAWELLSGTLLASQAWTSRLSWLPRNVLALVGLAMIGFAIMAYTAETPFPGAAAFIPCLGTVLIIAAGQSGGSLVASVLSLRPVVFVGLISYSLYLWHWPIIFFQRSDALVFTNTSRLVIIICSFVIATLSWQFIEKPFRARFKAIPESRVLAAGLLTLAVVAVFAVFIVGVDGLPQRFSPTARAYATYLDYGQAHFREGTCFIDTPYTFADFDREQCLRSDSRRKTYLLIGDSHAAQLWYGLSTLMAGANILQATAAGCRPDVTGALPASASCGQLMNYMFSDYLNAHKVDELLIGARWLERDLPGLEHTLAWAKSRTIPVILFGPMVEYDSALPRILANAAQNNDTAAPARHQLPNNIALDAQLKALAAAYGARYVSYYKLLCGPEHCLDLAPDGSPIEFDTDHLTRQGSQFIVKKILATGQLK